VGTEVLTPADLSNLENTKEAQNTATYQEALFNCVNILLGCGVLSIPYALDEGGWAAFAVLALMWVATNHTGKTLIECQEYFNRFPETFPAKGSTIKLSDGVMASCVASLLLRTEFICIHESVSQTSAVLHRNGPEAWIVLFIVVFFNIVC
jgi:vesicular inhibitory amino acid transporter